MVVLECGKPMLTVILMPSDLFFFDTVFASQFFQHRLGRCLVDSTFIATIANYLTRRRERVCLCAFSLEFNVWKSWRYCEVPDRLYSWPYFGHNGFEVIDIHHEKRRRVVAVRSCFKAHLEFLRFDKMLGDSTNHVNSSVLARLEKTSALYSMMCSADLLIPDRARCRLVLFVSNLWLPNELNLWEFRL